MNENERETLEREVKELGEAAEALRFTPDRVPYREARKAYLLKQAELYHARRQWADELPY